MDPQTAQSLLAQANREVMYLVGFFWVWLILCDFIRFRRAKEKALPISRHFGLSDIALSLLGPFIVGMLLFVVFSGYANFSAMAHLFKAVAFDGWAQHCIVNSGFRVPVDFFDLRLPDEDLYQQITPFLAALASMGVAMPLAVAASIFCPKSFDFIKVAPAYLKFPARFLLGLHFRLKRRWSDLASVSTKSTYNQGKNTQMVLKFKSGGCVVLSWADLPRTSMTYLLQAICEHAPDSVTSETIETYGHKPVLRAEPQIEPSVTYTDLWDADYKRHYHSTTFVPLIGGALLQGKKYKVLSHFSSTPMSATYLAETNTGARVVVKESTASIDTEAGQKAREMYLRECDHLSKLDHPRIAKVMDSFVENGRSYLAIEYLPGQDLNSLLALKGRISEEDVLHFSGQIAEILQYLHEQEPPVIHRDISPHNLVVDRDKIVYLIDFGAANRFEADVTGTLIGKQSYIAPEQLRGKATPQSDIYSLGATMFTLLTGEEPEALSVCSPRERQPYMSDDVNELVEQCTQPDLDARIQTASQVRERIDELMSRRNQTSKLEAPAAAERISLKSKACSYLTDK